MNHVAMSAMNLNHFESGRNRPRRSSSKRSDNLIHLMFDWPQ
jgi:hypothetical protein